MSPLTAYLVQFVLALLLAPLLPGIINRVKAKFAGRHGKPLLQLYFDIFKLLRKGEVVSRSASFVLSLGPAVSLATAAWVTSPSSRTFLAATAVFFTLTWFHCRLLFKYSELCINAWGWENTLCICSRLPPGTPRRACLTGRKILGHVCFTATPLLPTRKVPQNATMNSYAVFFQKEPPWILTRRTTSAS